MVGKKQRKIKKGVVEEEGKTGVDLEIKGRL